MNPRRLRPVVRWTTYLLAAAGLGYLALRFETHTLAREGCSPLIRFAPGTSLLLDRYPRHFGQGDALLFRGPDARIYLGLVQRLRAEDGAIWVEVDNPACAGVGSGDLGWIPREECVARVVMVWPW